MKTGCFCCSKTSNSESFIQKSKELHNDKYCYSSVKYKNDISEVDIICTEHGIFKISPNQHLRGTGCKKCLNLSTDLDSFIKKANLKHSEKYDYSNVVYTGKENKIDIICKKHGIFKQTPHNHLAGNGCPICKESIGESVVSKFLRHKDISYTPQKRFNECDNNRRVLKSLF